MPFGRRNQLAGNKMNRRRGQKPAVVRNIEWLEAGTSFNWRRHAGHGHVGVANAKRGITVLIASIRPAIATFTKSHWLLAIR